MSAIGKSGPSHAPSRWTDFDPQRSFLPFCESAYRREIGFELCSDAYWRHYERVEAVRAAIVAEQRANKGEVI